MVIETSVHQAIGSTVSLHLTKDIADQILESYYSIPIGVEQKLDFRCVTGVGYIDFSLEADSKLVMFRPKDIDFTKQVSKFVFESSISSLPITFKLELARQLITKQQSL